MSDTGKSTIDVAQLVKILSLTQSDSDGEALSAMRMANSKLKAAGITWQDIFNNQPNQSKPEVKKAKKEARWKYMPKSYDGGYFRAAMACNEFSEVLDKNQLEWINQLIRYYNAHRYIPQKHWTDFAELWYNFVEADRER